MPPSDLRRLLLPPVPMQPSPVSHSPGYALSASAARSLQEVRVNVADAAVLQGLRAQIMAPAPSPSLSSATLTDLASLVRQAQIASANATAAASSARSALDPIQLAQAQTNVRAAQKDWSTRSRLVTGRKKLRPLRKRQP